MLAFLSVSVVTLPVSATTNDIAVATVVNDYVTTFGTSVNGSASAGGSYVAGSLFSTATAPTGGQVSWSAGGAWTYTPNQGFSGVDSFVYSVCAPPNFTGCASSTATIVVGPHAADYTSPAPPDSQVSGDVASQSVFPTGSTFSPTGVSDPAHGSIASFQSNGNWIFAVGSNWTGTLLLSYDVCLPAPNASVCDSGTILFQVGIEAVGDFYSTPAETSLDGAAPPGDTYPTGSSFTRTSDPANGSVIWNTDGTYTYIPNRGFVGLDSFTYRVCMPAPFAHVCDDAAQTITVMATAVPAFTG